MRCEDLSSTEPTDRRDRPESRAEVPAGLIVTCGDGAGTFHTAEKFLIGCRTSSSTLSYCPGVRRFFLGGIAAIRAAAPTHIFAPFARINPGALPAFDPLNGARANTAEQGKLFRRPTALQPEFLDRHSGPFVPCPAMARNDNVSAPSEIRHTDDKATTTSRYPNSLPTSPPSPF